MGVWDDGAPPGWGPVRIAVLKRDGYRCQYRFKGCREVASQVNHTEGDNADPLDMRFLKAACKPCNQHIGDPTKKAGAHEVEAPDWLADAVNERRNSDDDT